MQYKNHNFKRLRVTLESCFKCLGSYKCDLEVHRKVSYSTRVFSTLKNYWKEFMRMSCDVFPKLIYKLGMFTCFANGHDQRHLNKDFEAKHKPLLINENWEVQQKL